MMYRIKTMLLSSVLVIFSGCGEEESTGTVVAGVAETVKSFETLETSETFKWNTSNILSLNLFVKEDVVTVNIDGKSLDSQIVDVDSAIVTLGYEDNNLTTVKTNNKGEISLSANLPTYITDINLYATSNGFTQKREVSLTNISQEQTILIERSPEPTEAEFTEEGQ